jgi:hypothetical protein
VINNNLIYNQLVNEVPAAGITYLRGRIKLKNGAVVYTDIIPVLTSGKKSILFYPNPVPEVSANACIATRIVYQQQASVL